MCVCVCVVLTREPGECYISLTNKIDTYTFCHSNDFFFMLNLSWNFIDIL